MLASEVQSQGDSIFTVINYANVEVRWSSVVGMQVTSLHALSTKPRFSSFSAPWAGPCVPLTLSLKVVGRQALRGPASEEVDREETFPSLESPMADDG